MIDRDHRASQDYQLLLDASAVYMIGAMKM